MALTGEAKRAHDKARYLAKTGKTETRAYVSNELAKMTLREVGVILGVSATTVMMEERVALQKFCDRLEEACEDMREEFYAGLESNRTGNSGGVQRILSRPELGRIA